MVNTALRNKALECFKSLLRARKEVFEGDNRALIAAHKKIREEFLKYKDETDQKKIRELVELGFQVAKMLRTSVIQARLTPEGNYRLRITKNVDLKDSPGPTDKKPEN